MEESLKGFGEEGFCSYFFLVLMCRHNCLLIIAEETTNTKCDKGDDDDDNDNSDDDKYAINLSDDDEDENGGQKMDTDGLPFACYICRDRFTNPVVTVCKHYFCSACALEYAKRNKTKNCALCGKNTSGVFNHAAKLAKKIATAKKS